MNGYALSLLSGALICLGFPGVGLWPLAFVAFVPLFAALDADGTGGLRAFGMGWLCGAAAQAAGTYWLVDTLARFSGQTLLVSVFVALIVWLVEGARLGVFAWLLVRSRTCGWSPGWVAPFAYAGVELGYPLVFPSQFGASLHAVPVLVQAADLGGVTLVSMLIVLVNAALHAVVRGALARTSVGRWLPVTAFAALVSSTTYGVVRSTDVDLRTRQASKLRVGVVQPNLGVREKRRGRAEVLERHLALSRALERSARRPLDLLLWPETALPGSLDADALVAPRVTDGLVTPVLFGSLVLDARGPRPGLYNSALLVDASGTLLGRHDKLALLPFAEHVPFGDRLSFVHRWSPTSGRLRAGEPGPPLDLAGRPITALVCYEDVLPALVRDLVREGNPQLLVNLTNDAWFGDTTEPWIHLALSKLRAIEHRRFLVRATNSGVSAIVDPVGRVVAQAPTFEAATLVAEVALLDGATAYARFGDWPGWLGLLVTASVIAVPRRRARP